MESIGDADTLEAQSKAILMENDIRDEEFSNEVRKRRLLFFARRSVYSWCFAFRWFNVYP